MKQLSPSDAKVKLDDGELTLIDVREQYEIDTAAVPGSIHIPMGQIPQRLDEIPRNEPVAFLCHSGARSGRVTSWLLQQGFDNVLNIQGGIERWAQIDDRVPRYKKVFGQARIIE